VRVTRKQITFVRPPVLRGVDIWTRRGCGGELKTSPRRGTQSIQRAIGLLREISTRGQFGLQLSDLAARCRLDKSTAHRMLICLVRERLVSQRASDRRYLPGPMLFELGLALPELGELQYRMRSRLAALASAGAAFLLFRSGDDFVCAARVGSIDKALTISPGTRRPLVTSAGGAAIMLALPVGQARAIINRNFATLRGMGYDRARLRAIRDMLERSHAEGFAINAGDTLPEVNAFGLALRDSAGEPFASITVEGSAQALPLSRLPEIRCLMQAVVEELREESP
jgi:DNA-binding IclR family transcriptional regulator